MAGARSRRRAVAARRRRALWERRWERGLKWLARAVLGVAAVRFAFWMWGW